MKCTGLARFTDRCVGLAVSLSLSMLLLPSTATTACVQWNLSKTGRWSFYQSNGYVLSIGFRQDGRSLQGNAAYAPAQSGDQESVQGTLHGTISGSSVEFTVRWGNGLTGAYRGTVSDDGTVAGECHDIASPRSRATWKTQTGKATCIEEVGPPSRPGRKKESVR